MKRKILSLILAAACFTAAGCSEVKKSTDSSAESSFSESNSEQSSASSNSYNTPIEEQSASSSETSSVSSTPDLSSSSNITASSSKPVSSSSSAPSSTAISSSKPVSSSTTPQSSVNPVSSSSSAPSSTAFSSSKPVSSSTTPQSSVNNEQNSSNSPQIIGNYNQRAPEQWEIEYANEVFRLTNIERVKAGLPEFKQMQLLDNSAWLRAWECLVVYDHTRPDGRDFNTALDEAGIKWRRCGENIAAGQKTPQDVVNAWMNSSGHRANILKKEYEYLGVGFYYDYNNESSTPQYDYFWAQNFLA